MHSSNHADNDSRAIADRLSRISTHWSLVFDAHRSTADTQVLSAQTTLLERYCGAVYRYILGALRDTDAADEVAQNFAICFARGDFKRADPNKGRFRDFLRTVVYHQIVNYQRERKKQQRIGAAPYVDNVADPQTPRELEEEFVHHWRAELLDRVWDALEEEQQADGAPYFTVLRKCAEQVEATSQQIAEQLKNELGRSFTAAAVRQILHRARQRFADLTIEETARSLQTDCNDEIEQELIDLHLMEYCKTAWEKRRRGQSNETKSIT